MAGTSMRTDVGTLKKASTDIADATERLNASVKKLQGEFADLSALWIGSGSAEFQTLAGAWVERHSNLQRVLSEISGAVNSTAIAQDSNEQDVQAMMRQTAAQLA